MGDAPLRGLQLPLEDVGLLQVVHPVGQHEGGHEGEEQDGEHPVGRAETPVGGTVRSRDGIS